MSSATVAIHINDLPPMAGVLTIEREVITQSTALPRPNPEWSTVDDAGHFHAATQGEERNGRRDIEYPTLDARMEHRDCDGSCGGTCGGEGYHVTRYSCRICGAEIEPGVLLGEHTFTMPGLIHWSVEVQGGEQVAGLYHQHVTVLTTREQGYAYLGVAVGTDLHVEFDLDGPRATLKLLGDSPLGRLTHNPRPPAAAAPVLGGAGGPRAAGDATRTGLRGAGEGRNGPG